MKAFLFLCVSAMAMTAGAWGLESHYGQVTHSGNEYTCTFQNQSGQSLDMKYVVFNFDRTGGGFTNHDVQERIDQVVDAGKSLSSTIELAGPYIVNNCYFLAR